MRWFSIECDLKTWALAIGLIMESGASYLSKKRPHLLLAIGPIIMAFGPNADQVV